jgi:hypothetical protein
MRSGLLALLVCVSFKGLCQSAAPGAVAPRESIKSQQTLPLWTACNKLAPAISAECFAPQIEASDGFDSRFSGSGLPQIHLLIAQNTPPNLYPTPLPASPHAKCEPIPTRWPNGKLEEIPTQWPHAVLALIGPEAGASFVVQAPAK